MKDPSPYDPVEADAQKLRESTADNKKKSHFSNPVIFSEPKKLELFEH